MTSRLTERFTLASGLSRVPVRRIGEIAFLAVIEAAYLLAAVVIVVLASIVG